MYSLPGRLLSLYDVHSFVIVECMYFSIVSYVFFDRMYRWKNSLDLNPVVNCGNLTCEMYCDGAH